MMVIGSGEAKAGSRSTASPSGKASISSFASASTRGLQPLDLPRDEGAVDQRAQPRVDRRLEFQHRMRLDRVEGGKVRTVAVGAAAVGNADRALPAEAPVAQQAVDVVETAEAPVAELFPEERAALAVQPGIGFIRVLVETLVARIEPQAAGRGVEGKIGWWRSAGVHV